MNSGRKIRRGGYGINRGGFRKGGGKGKVGNRGGFGGGKGLGGGNGGGFGGRFWSANGDGLPFAFA